MLYRTKLFIAFSLSALTYAIWLCILGAVSATLTKSTPAPALFGKVEAFVIVVLSIITLYLFPYLIDSMKTYRAYDSRKLRALYILGSGCLFGAAITLLVVYLPITIGLSNSIIINVNMFGEAVAELFVFFFVGVPAFFGSVYSVLKYYWHDRF